MTGETYEVHVGAEDFAVLGPDCLTVRPSGGDAHKATAVFGCASDAHRFVRAVNAHDELVAALKAMVSAYREGSDDADEPAMVREALAALARASGREVEGV